jgi:hypothetical protein
MSSVFDGAGASPIKNAASGRSKRTLQRREKVEVREVERKTIPPALVWEEMPS